MTLSPELEARKNALYNSIGAGMRRSRNAARWNHGASLTLMIAALLATVAAGVVGIVYDLGEWAGGLAVLPALIGIVATNLKLQGKAQWHSEKEGELRELRSRLRYQLPESPTADHIAAIAKSRGTMEKRMREEWVKHLQFDWAGLGQRHPSPTHQLNAPLGASASTETDREEE
jgi:hypothetical protein